MFTTRRRAVITGLGIIAPNGIDKDSYWHSLTNGISGIAKITAFDPTKYTTQIAGEVKDFDATKYMSKSLVNRSGRFTHFSIGAATMAVNDSGLCVNNENGNRCAVCFGTTIGAQNHLFARQYQNFMEKGITGVSPFTAVEFSPHIITGHVATKYNICGPNASISSGCSTGLDVIAWGLAKIKASEADVTIVGSADTPVFPFSISALSQLQIISTRNSDPQKASRPYDAERDGMVPSEGGFALVIEDLNHALNRKANIYAEIAGYASTSDGNDVVKIDLNARGLDKALNQSLLNARIDKRDVNYICSHGNAMPQYDIAETIAFKRFFGDLAYEIPVSSIKSMTGQPFAAGGGFQAVATAMSISNSIIPPTINLDNPDPLCDLDYVPHTARVNNVDVALINTHSVGGTHAALVLCKY